MNINKNFLLIVFIGVFLIFMYQYCKELGNSFYISGPKETMYVGGEDEADVEDIEDEAKLSSIRDDVRELCDRFPMGPMGSRPE